jgi:Raf kinase inhibitor-like YbhB/YbcL family protein
VRRLVAMPLAFVALTVLAAGCKHDGREMRAAQPGQDGSVSTSAAPTTQPLPTGEGDFFDTVASDQSSTTGKAGSTSTTTAAASTSTTTTAPVVALTVTAPWRDGAPIDARYTCKGANVSPALSWSAAPEGTQEIAVTLIDQDAAFDHWTMAGIGPDVTSLAEGAAPSGAAVALNGSGTASYTGPCPPAGTTHTYRITVYYLDRALLLTGGGPAADMRTAIDAATMTKVQVIGTFVGS